MKIIFTTHTYWPQKDGVQYVTQYMAEGLAKRGHQVVVFVPQTTEKRIITEEHNGVKVIRPYVIQKYSFYFGKLKAFKKSFLGECKDADCLISCAILSPINNFTLPLLRKISAKKILYLHGVYDRRIYSAYRPRIKARKALVNARWDVFMKVHGKRFNDYDLFLNIRESTKDSEFFKKAGVNRKQLMIANATESFDDVCVNDELLKKYPFLKKPYFLNVSNFNVVKNQKFLIKAYAEFCKKTDSDVQLVMVGGTDRRIRQAYATECRKLISKLECRDKIHIIKNLSREDTKVIIKNCYCAAMSSTREVCPIFLCEAIMCAHPFISTRVGSVNELEGGVFADTVSEYAEQMVKLTTDKEFFNELAAKGKAFADANLTQKEKVKELETIIVNLTNG